MNTPYEEHLEAKISKIEDLIEVLKEESIDFYQQHEEGKSEALRDVVVRLEKIINEEAV